MLVFATLTCHASLIKVTVDVMNPPAGFSKVFAIDIKHENNLCIITISYDSELKEKISEKLPDGYIIEYYTEGGIQACHLLLYNDQNILILTAPVYFKKGHAGRSSACIIIQKDLLKLFKLQIYIPVMIESFCYELHFNNVE